MTTIWRKNLIQGIRLIWRLCRLCSKEIVIYFWHTHVRSCLMSIYFVLITVVCLSFIHIDYLRWSNIKCYRRRVILNSINLGLRNFHILCSSVIVYIKARISSFRDLNLSNLSYFIPKAFNTSRVNHIINQKPVLWCIRSQYSNFLLHLIIAWLIVRHAFSWTQICHLFSNQA